MYLCLQELLNPLHFMHYMYLCLQELLNPLHFMHYMYLCLQELLNLLHFMHYMYLCLQKLLNPLHFMHYTYLCLQELLNLLHFMDSAAIKEGVIQIHKIIVGVTVGRTLYCTTAKSIATYSQSVGAYCYTFSARIYCCS